MKFTLQVKLPKEQVLYGFTTGPGTGISIMFTVCNGQLELLFKHSFPSSPVFGKYIFQCEFIICVMANHMGWISPKIWSDLNFPASYQRLSFFVCRQNIQGKRVTFALERRRLADQHTL